MKSFVRKVRLWRRPERGEPEARRDPERDLLTAEYTGSFARDVGPLLGMRLPKK